MQTDSQPFLYMDHPALGPVRYSVRETSDNPDQQVSDTIALMGQYASEDANDPRILSDVAQAWSSGDPIDDTFGYIKGRLQFVNDEVTAEPLQSGYAYPIVETLCRPRDMAVAPYPQGDCDDFSMYGAAHLIARGVPVSFATVAADGSNYFSHVYLVAYPKTGKYAGLRVPMDLSHGPYPGWEYSRGGRKKEWPIGDCSAWMMIAAVAIGFAIFKGVN